MKRMGTKFFAGLLFAMAALTAPVAGGTIGEPLPLADYGSFFLNGQLAASDYASIDAGGKQQAGHYMRNQIYVQYFIPRTVRGAPIIMVPGAYHNGTVYETTPDGREGWATYFVRQGYPVYLVDQAGRGRSGFDATIINQARVHPDALADKAVPQPTQEAAWISYRLGPHFPDFWPDSQFPAEALDVYSSQVVPLTESLLDQGTRNTVDGLEKLLEKIGPAMVLVHSQSGAFGLDLVRRNHKLVKALVIIEGNCTPVTKEEMNEKFITVPLLAVFGDHTENAPGLNGDGRRNGCSSTVSALQGAGADATFLLLPKLGIHGNSHIMMIEKNNLQIAELIRNWLAAHAKPPNTP